MLEINAPFVREFAGTLSSGERLVVMLVYGERLTLPEVAEVMETPLEHVEYVLDQVQDRCRVARAALIDALVGV
ncbi:MAG: sigma factor-like helix-turn-helix DNA-binding protein [Planctomycetota bacterium]|nr:sigma factor-like helix-turn-helix DNA-binding protein [Planctomycetota bacterium]